MNRKTMKNPTSNKKRRLAPKRRKAASKQRMEFPEARGRTVEMVELFADSDFPCISIRFKDKTDLTVVIDPLLSFSADFSDWKTHNQRVLKTWRTIRSDGL